MIRILFICHGNIARSPTAEFVFKDLVKNKGLSASFYISSAATSSEEVWRGVGNPVYPPAKRELKKHGIDCGDKKAVQLVREDYERYDLLIGMDSANIRNMKALFGDDKDGKIHKLLDYTDRHRDIVDPWYSGEFDKAYSDIYEGCSALLAYICNRSGI